MCGIEVCRRLLRLSENQRVGLIMVTGPTGYRNAVRLTKEIARAF
jgi:hypothetical protein